MKLASKIVLLFLACLTCVVVVFSYLSVRQTQDLILAEHERHAADLAASLELAIAESPQPMEQLDRKLLAWSQSVEHLEIRVVNPSAEEGGRRPAVPESMIRLTRKVVTVRYPDAGGDSRIYTYIPMNRRGDDESEDASFQLEISAPELFWSDHLSNSLRTAGIGLAAVAIFTSIVILLGGYWMVGQPLKRMLTKVNQIADGDLDCPVEVDRKDELGQLGAAMNEMCVQLKNKQEAIETQTAEKLAAVEQLRHTDRLRTVGRLAAGIAHELGTPLNVVSGRAELLASGRLDSDQIVESANAIKGQTERITSIVRQLLDFSRQGTTAKEAVNLAGLLETCVELLSPLASRRGVTLNARIAKDPANAVDGIYEQGGQDGMSNAALAIVNASQIQQVMTNLIVNAIQASEEGGSIAVSARLIRRNEIADANFPDGESLPDGVDRFWAFEVQDSGQGIEPENLNQLFEPFFTTKDVGEGTGLGLSISSNIVHDHRGAIAVSSRPGEGSQFTVYLPADEIAEGGPQAEENKRHG